MQFLKKDFDRVHYSHTTVSAIELTAIGSGGYRGASEMVAGGVTMCGGETAVVRATQRQTPTSRVAGRPAGGRSNADRHRRRRGERENGTATARETR